MTSWPQTTLEIWSDLQSPLLVGEVSTEFCRNFYKNLAGLLWWGWIRVPVKSPSGFKALRKLLLRLVRPNLALHSENLIMKFFSVTSILPGNFQQRLQENLEDDCLVCRYFSASRCCWCADSSQCPLEFVTLLVFSILNRNSQVKWKRDRNVKF